MHFVCKYIVREGLFISVGCELPSTEGQGSVEKYDKDTVPRGAQG